MRAIRLKSIAAIAFISLLLPSHASALAQRTFVSAIGTDNPSCSIAAPCRSFGTAITATNPGGEIIVLESAGYGPVTITKSVSIIAPPGIYGGISVAAELNGVTINAPGATVVLRGLSINGQGGNYGILSQQASRVRVEHCVVSNMGAVAIYHTAPNGEMIVTDTIVRDNTDGVGLVSANGTSIVLDHVRSERNTNSGFYIAPSSPGDYVYATILDSVFIYNGANGIWADTVGGAHTITDVQRSIVSKNGLNGFLATAGASNSHSVSTLKGGAFIGNGGSGVNILAPFGIAYAIITDNGFGFNGSGNGIIADGTGAELELSRNAGQLVQCSNGAYDVETYQDNSIAGFFGCSPFTRSTK